MPVRKEIKVNFSPTELNKLPRSSGVYISGCGKKIDYIGSSGNIQRRVKQQVRNDLSGCFIKAIPTKTRRQAYDLERNLIAKKCPTQNKTKPSNCKSDFLSRFLWG